MLVFTFCSIHSLILSFSFSFSHIHKQMKIIFVKCMQMSVDSYFTVEKRHVLNGKSNICVHAIKVTLFLFPYRSIPSVAVSQSRHENCSLSLVRSGFLDVCVVCVYIFEDERVVFNVSFASFFDNHFIIPTKKQQQHPQPPLFVE